MVLCLCFTMHVFSQNLTIKGVVLDETGQSVIGATVLEEGTENGTITNLDGEFFLTVAKGKSLVISYIGFETQRIRVVNEKQLKIILHEDSELLDEVVVVGYGVKQKRSTMTTAISKMDQKVLQNAALSNAAQALQGTVSGLRVTNTSGAPGSAPTIVLRGGAGIESAGVP